MTGMETAVAVLSSSTGTKWEKAVNELGSERLICLLDDRDFTLACRAAAGLGYLRDKRAVPSLIRLLTHEDWGARNNAALALGEIGLPTALESLGEATLDSDGTVARNAAKAIEQIRKQTSTTVPQSNLPPTK